MSVHWVSANYSRPTCVEHIHPDLPYKCPDEIASIFLSDGADKRKRATPDSSRISMWDDPDYLKCREVFKTFGRRGKDEGMSDGVSLRTHVCESKPLDVYVVDVVESLADVSQVAGSFDVPVTSGLCPVLTVLGVCVFDDISVCARVWGFMPYVVAECPKWVTERMVKDGVTELQTFIERNLSKANVAKRCLRVEVLRGKPLLDYRGEEADAERFFYKIVVGAPALVSSCKTLIESGIRLNAFDKASAHANSDSGDNGVSSDSGMSGTGAGARSGSLSATPYEASVPFSLRWMIDQEIVGCGCIRLARVRKVPDEFRRTRCNLELDLHYTEVSKIELTGVYEKVPDSLRTLAIDIECVTTTGTGFPVPERDKVIQISAVLQRRAAVAASNSSAPTKTKNDVKSEEAAENEAENVAPPAITPLDPSMDAKAPLAGEVLGKVADDGKVGDLKMIFTLDTCAPIPDATVFSFRDERVMLSAFREMIVFVDPDILTGYNFVNFDLNYLVVRSRSIDVPNLRNLGRVIDVATSVRNSTLSTRALGTHENKDINCEGRISFDCLEFVRREYKLKSYTLNAVSAHFLKEQKEDVHYSQIGHLQRGNAETRKRIALYCIKDSVLVLRLLEALCAVVNTIEMARVTGIPISMLLSRGQQIKVTSQLMRKCRELNYFFPTLKVQGGEREIAYEGATVLDPLKAFYDVPIATLDFASLYPSIMIAHNLCYSTLLPDGEASVARFRLTPDDYIKTPAGKFFVKASKRKGLLPTVVQDLLAARKKAKTELKKASEGNDSLLKMVLDARQLALKISANSVYGYTGASQMGQLPCLPISESITAFGRQMIDTSKSAVEERYKAGVGGATADAVVVYGDTDSIMVKFGVTSVADAMRLGREAAAYVSAQFPPPIALEFEKVFYPFLLMNKKRYAGLKWEREDVYSKIDCKGIETVRRDFCALVQKMVDDALKKLLIDRDVSGALDITKKRIQDLLQNKVDLSYLVLSKSLGKEDYAAKLAHVELAKKLRKRDPATAPQIGDRVFYVIVAGAKGQPQFERGEDPLYALENNIPIDYDFYLDSIKNPISRIFEPVLGESKLSSLFCGTHTSVKKIAVGGIGALSSFVVSGLRCLGCRSVINSGAFCQHCSTEKRVPVVFEKLRDFSDKERDFHRLWIECQRCQGSMFQDVICTSRDCPIFYRRMKSKKELNQLTNSVISRLNAEDW